MASKWLCIRITGVNGARTTLAMSARSYYLYWLWKVTCILLICCLWRLMWQRQAALNWHFHVALLTVSSNPLSLVQLHYKTSSPEVIRDECVALMQLCTKSTLVTMGRPNSSPKLAFPLQQTPPHLIHPSPTDPTHHNKQHPDQGQF